MICSPSIAAIALNISTSTHLDLTKQTANRPASCRQHVLALSLFFLSLKRLLLPCDLLPLSFSFFLQPTHLRTLATYIISLANHESRVVRLSCILAGSISSRMSSGYIFSFCLKWTVQSVVVLFFLVRTNQRPLIRVSDAAIPPLRSHSRSGLRCPSWTSRPLHHLFARFRPTTSIFRLLTDLCASGTTICSSFSLSEILVSESLVCCCGSPTTPTPSPTSQPSVSTLYDITIRTPSMDGDSHPSTTQSTNEMLLNTENPDY